MQSENCGCYLSQTIGNAKKFRRREQGFQIDHLEEVYVIETQSEAVAGKIFMDNKSSQLLSLTSKGILLGLSLIHI